MNIEEFIVSLINWCNIQTIEQITCMNNSNHFRYIYNFQKMLCSSVIKMLNEGITKKQSEQHLKENFFPFYFRKHIICNVYVMYLCNVVK